MDPQRYEELRGRVTMLLEQGEDPLVDEVWLNPISVYQDDDHLERENERLFARYPVIVGRGDQLPEPGDFVTHEHSGRSILLTRAGDGQIRAFHNVCRHRGARVESEHCGNARRFSCPYHAWTYDIEGTLVSIPNGDGFDSVERATHGLVPIAAAEHLGFVWVNLGADASEPLDIASYLGDMGVEIGGFDIANHVHDIYEVLEQPFNWKLVVDGFLETYHLRFLHRDTIGPYIRSNFALVDAFGPHLRMVGVRESVEGYLADGDPAASMLPHLAIIYLVYPNTILVWQGDHFETWTAWPGRDGVASMVAEARLLAPTQVRTEAERDHWDRNWKILMGTVLNEDFVVARTMQHNYRSGAQTHATFGRQEGALQHFHRQLNDVTLVGDGARNGDARA